MTQTFIFLCSIAYYLCDFAVRDIKMAVYLESPRKINLSLVRYFFSKTNF